MTMVFTDIPNKRELQRHSGPIVQERDDLHRMVSSQKRLPENPKAQPTSPSGPVCNKLQQPTPDNCFPLPGRTSSGPGLSNSPLGQVGSLIPIPPDSIDFQGFGEDPTIRLHIRNFNNARNADETMVHGSQTTEYSIDCLTDDTTTEGGRSADQDEPTFKTSRLEVIRSTYEKRFHQCDRETWDLMSRPIASSSLRDYQNKWEAFIKFLRDRNISPLDLNISHVLSFLTFLFNIRKLKPRTISCYRSAISEPLLQGFIINSCTKEVCDLIRGMKRKRPADPPSQPAWSLKKVLCFIEDLEEPLSDTWVLRKAAFLLMLATGYRVSELHACVRDNDLCSFNEDMSLTIRPHPNFVAKNEPTQKRWPPKEIRPLPVQGVNPNNLCPVRALQTYLCRTSNTKNGRLFRRPGSELRDLSAPQLSKHICALITTADPHAKAKTHDIRKFAASYSLMKSMCIDEVVREIGWSSRSTFLRYYLVQTEELTMNVSLPLA